MMFSARFKSCGNIPTESGNLVGASNFDIGRLWFWWPHHECGFGGGFCSIFFGGDSGTLLTYLGGKFNVALKLIIHGD